MSKHQEGKQHGTRAEGDAQTYPLFSNPGEYRTILKFEDGIPVMKETNIPGINPLTRELQKRKKQYPGQPPILVVGDMCGLGKLNNEFGREVADRAVLHCLSEFASTFAGTGTSAGSPSGDEMWAVAHPGATLKSIQKNIISYLEKIQTAKFEIINHIFNFNARFLIGQTADLFADGEKYLKLPDGKNEKVNPGTITTVKAGKIKKVNPKKFDDDQFTNETTMFREFNNEKSTDWSFQSFSKKGGEA